MLRDAVKAFVAGDEALARDVITREQEVLALLEGEGEQMAARLTAEGHAAPRSATKRGPKIVRPTSPTPQLGFFGDAPAASPAMTKLADAMNSIEPDRMTPLEALTMLSSLKKDFSV